MICDINNVINKLQWGVVLVSGHAIKRIGHYAALALVVLCYSLLKD